MELLAVAGIAFLVGLFGGAMAVSLLEPHSDDYWKGYLDAMIEARTLVKEVRK